MNTSSSELRHWTELDAEEQTRIQVEYGYYLDTLPPTCSMDSKIARFQHWLKTEKGIVYPS